MNRSQKRKFNLVFLFTFLSAYCAAQNTFKYQSAIEKVTSDGLYKIYLNPKVVAYCKSDLSDLRIIDSKGKFISYANGAELPGDYVNFLSFPNLHQENGKDSTSTVVVENLSPESVTVLWLKLKNAAVQRNADLLGSDDRVNWYAIKESIPLTEATETESDYYFQSLTFPASSYKYFKIRIENKKKSPLNILQVGVYQDRLRSSRFDKLPLPIITQKDSSNNITYLDLQFDLRYQLNKLHIEIAAPKYYKRKVRMFEIVGKQKNLINETEIISGGAGDLYLNTKTNKIHIEIENEDNTPLTINKLDAFQNSKFIIAYLQSEASYKLIFADPIAKAPKYDLAFFTENNKGIISELSLSAISKNLDYKPQKTALKPDYKILMWTGLAISLLILSFLTFKMLNELKRK
ncbi:MAG: hypothetical protein JWQ25_1978 [Daejeonella sp.]|nr:hypothetical protein [Daejeonella sp.]